MEPSTELFHSIPQSLGSGSLGMLGDFPKQCRHMKALASKVRLTYWNRAFSVGGIDLSVFRPVVNIFCIASFMADASQCLLNPATVNSCIVDIAGAGKTNVMASELFFMSVLHV